MVACAVLAIPNEPKATAKPSVIDDFIELSPNVNGFRDHADSTLNMAYSVVNNFKSVLADILKIRSRRCISFIPFTFPTKPCSCRTSANELSSIASCFIADTNLLEVNLRFLEGRNQVFRRRGVL